MKEYRSVHFLALWGIWLARNALLFEDRHIKTFQVFAQICSLFQHYRMTTKVSEARQIGEILIDKTIPWGLFDGASKGPENLVLGGLIDIRQRICPI